MDAPDFQEPPFFLTELPAGYTKLVAGDKRPKGYLFRGRAKDCGWIHGSNALVGEPITDNNAAHMEFAAPAQ